MEKRAGKRLVGERRGKKGKFKRMSKEFIEEYQEKCAWNHGRKRRKEKRDKTETGER